MAQPQQVVTVPPRNETPRQCQQRLEAVASVFLLFLKVTAELLEIEAFGEAEVAIIGGLAVCHYLHDPRYTHDIDILITSVADPSRVCERLVAVYPHKFRFIFGFFYMETGYGLVQIDLMGEHLVLDRPGNLIPIQDISPKVLPYVSQETLIVFKAFCCGLRASEWKNKQDARDAYYLVQGITADGSAIRLNYHQAQIVHKALPALEKFGEIPADWWLGCFHFQVVLGLEWVSKVESKE